MKELKNRICKSGLKIKFIAMKIGLGDSHLTMMLNGNANMSDAIREKIETLLTDRRA